MIADRSWSRWSPFVLAGLGSIIVVACSAPPPNKTPLVVCEAGENGCPAATEKAKAKKTTEPDDSSSAAFPSSPPATSPTDPAKPSDATSAPDGGGGSNGALGAECMKLRDCCDALVVNGIYAEFCKEKVATGSEDACRAKYQEYREDPEGMMPSACALP